MPDEGARWGLQGTLLGDVGRVPEPGRSSCSLGFEEG